MVRANLFHQASPQTLCIRHLLLRTLLTLLLKLAFSRFPLLFHLNGSSLSASATVGEAKEGVNGEDQLASLLAGEIHLCQVGLSAFILAPDGLKTIFCCLVRLLDIDSSRPLCKNHTRIFKLALVGRIATV